MSAEETTARLDKLAEKRIDFWPEPQPLPGELPLVPEFPLAMMPDALRPFVADISARMQCPADFPAVASLVSVAAVVGRQIAIRPKQQDDWQVIPNLWGAIIGRPGVLKSPALQEPLKMLSRLDTAARDLFDTEQQSHDAAQMVARAEAKQTEKAIAAALKDGDSESAKRLALESVSREQTQPTRRRYMTSDATVEKLGELLRENPRGILLFRDELVGWLASLDRDGREGSRQFFLESWNGDGRFTFDRVGRGTVEIEAACVSVLGGIQPGPLGDYLRSVSRGGAGDDGLVQRMQMMVWPDVTGAFQNIDRWPDGAAKDNAWAAFQRLDSICPAEYGAVGDGVPFVRFDAEAQHLFDDWRERLEARLRSDELHPALESHLSKFRSLVPALALLFHLIDAESAAVSVRSLTRALAWAEYLEAHAARVHSATVATELIAARELHKHLVKGDMEDGFTARDVYLKGWRSLDRDTTKRALSVLEELDYVRGMNLDTGGRPKMVFTINPRINP